MEGSVNCDVEATSPWISMAVNATETMIERTNTRLDLMSNRIAGDVTSKPVDEVHRRRDEEHRLAKGIARLFKENMMTIQRA